MDQEFLKKYYVSFALEREQLYKEIIAFSFAKNYPGDIRTLVAVGKEVRRKGLKTLFEYYTSFDDDIPQYIIDDIYEQMQKREFETAWRYLTENPTEEQKQVVKLLSTAIDSLDSFCSTIKDIEEGKKACVRQITEHV